MHARITSGSSRMWLLGDTGLVPIALALHRRIMGDGSPFVVCDPRRPSGAHAVGSLGQIEKATLRLVALRSSGTIEQAPSASG